jgi:hypothetical protein
MNKIIITFFIGLIFNLSFSQIRDTVPHPDWGKIISQEKALEAKAKLEKSVKPFLISDTLYIYIKNKATVFETYDNYKSRKDTTITYRFYLKDSSHVEFFHKTYFDWDNREADIKSVVRRENKRFLRKHKNELLTYNFFKINKDKSIDQFLRMLDAIVSSKKFIYIIEQKHLKGKTITLKQVKFSRASHIFFLKEI